MPEATRELFPRQRNKEIIVKPNLPFCGFKPAAHLQPFILPFYVISTYQDHHLGHFAFLTPDIDGVPWSVIGC